MENKTDRNYNQDESNYKDAPTTTDFEKSKLENDPEQNHSTDEQFEEFSNDQPNRFDNDQNINSPESDDENWKANQNQEDDLNPNYDEERRRRRNLLKTDRDL